MFVGREEYLGRLSDLWQKDTASLAVVSGRRRIGKSTLVEKFAERSQCRFIELAGLAPDKSMTNRKQLAHFCERLARATKEPLARASCWPQAFDALASALSKGGRTIVFLDEISWMGGYDDGFAAYLKNAWDTQLSHCSGLILVLAGSVSAWIHDNILNSKGFVGRISLDLSLPELSLSECREFWGRRASRIALHEVLDVLSVTGGIPKYLQEVNPALTAAENIRRLCFLPEGYLFKDFDSIFSDVFGSAALKRRILVTLADGPATLSELSSRLAVAANGHVSEDLRDLEAAGFVASASGRNPETGAMLREVRYRLRDNYTRFFLKFIAPRSEAIRQGLFRFTSLEQLPGWEAVMGLQFENLVLNNLRALCPFLGLEGRLVVSAAPYTRRSRAASAGVQVDLLLQTPKSAYIIEVKRRRRITEAVEEEMQSKVERLHVPRGVSVRTALVYDGELAPAIRENGYIDFLVPVAKLFGEQ